MLAQFTALVEKFKNSYSCQSRYGKEPHLLMNSNSSLKIDLTAPSQRFHHYITTDNSERVIFSAPFGSGKTHFLNEFFQNSEYSKHYLPIHLHPVNYSVAQNEDIFELIKFDILFEILNNHSASIQNEEISEWLIALGYAKENPLAIFSDLVNIAGKVGFDLAGFSSLEKIATTVSKHLKDYQQFKEGKLEGEAIQRFIKSMQEKTGSIRERNDKTNQLIKTLLSRLKNNTNASYSVLVIDDLDRIDPDHIFRILNVFAAHFDVVQFENQEEDSGTETKTDNKFGFDKVILSCDINNIRRIFANRYGQDVDFSGYVDKFYTKEVFEYDIKRLIRLESEKLINNLKILDDPTTDIPNYYYLKNPNIIEYSYSFLTTLIEYDELNIRKLNTVLARDYLSIENFAFSYPISKILRNSLRNYSIQLFQFFEAIFGERANVKGMISRMSQKLKNNPTPLYLNQAKDLQLKPLLGFLIQNQDILENREKNSHIEFELEGSTKTFYGQLEKVDNFLHPFCAQQVTTKNKPGEAETNIDIGQFPLNSFEVMYEAFELYEAVYRNKDLT